jgi:hypothetical protein
MRYVLCAYSNHAPASSLGPRDAACQWPSGLPCPTYLWHLLERGAVTADVAAQPRGEAQAALYVPPARLCWTTGEATTRHRPVAPPSPPFRTCGPICAGIIVRRRLWYALPGPA